MSVPRFVHLSLHSEYSLIDSLVRINALVEKLKELQYSAIALTDRSNLFALVKFYRAMIAAGIKPIIGVEALVVNTEDDNNPHHMQLLVMNQTGYKNLSLLMTKSYREAQHLGKVMIASQWLEDHNEGLIAIAGSHVSDIARALLSGNKAIAKECSSYWARLFPQRFYIGISRCGRLHEEESLRLLVAHAEKYRLPVVALNDVRFIEQTDFEAHEIRVAIHEGYRVDDKKRPRYYTDQQYLRSEDEMLALFSDLPQALANTVEITKRCNLQLTLWQNYLPEYPAPKGMTTESLFREQCTQGLKARLQKTISSNTQDEPEKFHYYEKRLKWEIDIILQMGYPGYFQIVADFVQWAKEQGIPVGPGRGSGAGSLVAYALNITDLDPLEHDLLFERFLNPERVSMPDFDIDFCMDNRDRVIDYVTVKYGRDAVSQIITYGRMAAKAVVRDVGRVLGHPFGFVDRIAKLVPFELGITLSKALNDSQDLKQAYDIDEEVKALIDMAMQLEGLVRNAGKHAGGVVISPTVLTDFTPLYREPGGTNFVTQFDKDDVEAIGLVKFDFLGLRTLTIIDWALENIQKQGHAVLDIKEIDIADQAAFELLKTGNTTAVFQLESSGMQELICKLKPDSFDDITALMALYRPGPLGSGMVDDFINRKHGLAKTIYPHPALEPILKPTYGVILYQEQVMQIAQILAGYSLGGADLLRRAMGKKKPEEMAKQRDIFIKGALQRDVDKKTGEHIFDLMDKFAGYGFNKSHSCAYALISYQTLWLKTHYPAAFMAAVLSADMDNTDKVVHLIKECKAMGLELLPPDINKSDYKFSVNEDNQIIYGLGAVKGIGEASIEAIIDPEIRASGYSDIFDLSQRVDIGKVNKRTLENLIRCGALDCFGSTRATEMAHLPVALQMAEQNHTSKAAGQNDLFGIGSTASQSEDQYLHLPERQEWTDDVKLQAEYETLGFYLSGHPLDQYRDAILALGITHLNRISTVKTDPKDRKGQPIRIVGRIEAISRRDTQRGPMATILLDDQTGSIDVPFFNEAWELSRDILIKGNLVFIEGTLGYDAYRETNSVRGHQALLLEDARVLYAKTLIVKIDTRQKKNSENQIEQLTEMLTPWREGDAEVVIDFVSDQFQGKMRLGDKWRLTASSRLIWQMKQNFGTDNVKVNYRL